MLRLDGKRILVVGGTAGMGLGVAEHFAGAGAQVVIAGRRDASDAAQRIGARAVQFDIADEAQVEQGMKAAQELLGQLDVLVINAGIYLEDGPLADEAPDRIRRVVDVNLLGGIWCLKFGQVHMADGGSIVCTLSVTGTDTTTFQNTAYTASKAGLDYAARTAAVELGGRGIRVNSVSPGAVLGTEMDPPADLVAKLTQLGRAGHVEDLLGAFGFLASDESRYVTGQTLRVDGGMTAGISGGVLSALMSDE